MPLYTADLAEPPLLKTTAWYEKTCAIVDQVQGLAEDGRELRHGGAALAEEQRQLVVRGAGLIQDRHGDAADGVLRALPVSLGQRYALPEE